MSTKHYSDLEEALFFFIPIVGFIVYFVTVNANPEKARYALKISAIGILAGFALGFVLFVL